jgi:sporulation protein YlmC with PRC-barrel domain
VNGLIDFESLLGKKVIGTGGYILGEVKGASVDTKTWQVIKFHVKLSDAAAEELGLKKRFRSSSVNLPVKLVKAVGDVITISLSMKEMGESTEISEYQE